jgi:hypothetical protein
MNENQKNTLIGIYNSLQLLEIKGLQNIQIMYNVLMVIQQLLQEKDEGIKIDNTKKDEK